MEKKKEKKQCGRSASSWLDCTDGGAELRRVSRAGGRPKESGPFFLAVSLVR